VARRVLESLWVSILVGYAPNYWIDAVVVGNIVLFLMAILSFWAWGFEKKWSVAQIISALSLLCLSPQVFSFISQTQGYFLGWLFMIVGFFVLPWSWVSGLWILGLSTLAYDLWFLAILAPAADVFVNASNQKKLDREKFKKVLYFSLIVYGWHKLALVCLPAGRNLGFAHDLGVKVQEFFFKSFSWISLRERLWWIIVSTLYALGPFIIFTGVLKWFAKPWTTEKQNVMWPVWASQPVFLIPIIMLAFGGEAWVGDRILALCARYSVSVFYGLAFILSSYFLLCPREAQKFTKYIVGASVASGVITFLSFLGYSYFNGSSLYPWAYVFQIPGYGAF
jgi:hypothetical protein